jgi:hypothetical protein
MSLPDYEGKDYYESDQDEPEITNPLAQDADGTVPTVFRTLSIFALTAFQKPVTSTKRAP